MAHKGLNLDVVVKAAAELIEQQGRDAFSMRLLAEHCSIPADNISIPVFLRANENDGYTIPHRPRPVYQNLRKASITSYNEIFFVDRLVILCYHFVR